MENTVKYNIFEELKFFLRSMRPSQWTKNFVIFSGLIFAEHLFLFHDTLKVFGGFILFCLLCSSIYIINDIVDYEKDKIHPKKSKRPIASGKLSKKNATYFAVFLVILSLSVAFFLEFRFFLISLLYFILNIAYSFKLKSIVILDVLSISFSFVLRAVSGAYVINVIISPWLLVCTFLLALFMAIGKRRGEIILLDTEHANHRAVLSSYSVIFLDQMLSIVASSILIAYSLYTFTSGKSVNLMVTIPFVLYGIFRYLYLMYQKNMGDNPTSIFISDRPLQINMLCWIISVIIIFYLKHIHELINW